MLRFWKDESGASAAEYALILAIVGAAIMLPRGETSLTRHITAERRAHVLSLIAPTDAARSNRRRMACLGPSAVSTCLARHSPSHLARARMPWLHVTNDLCAAFLDVVPS